MEEKDIESDDMGFQLAFKAVAGLIAEQKTMHLVLQGQAAGTAELKRQIEILHQGQEALTQSSERSMHQQELLLEAMTKFADTSSTTQKRLSRMEHEIEELKRRLPEAS